MVIMLSLVTRMQRCSKILFSREPTHVINSRNALLRGQGLQNLLPIEKSI